MTTSPNSYNKDIEMLAGLKFYAYHVNDDVDFTVNDFLFDVARRFAELTNQEFDEERV